jgi:Xaa-Pro aminopeptidase
MTALMLYGDTEHSAALRHEVPLAILDPFLYVEDSGTTWLMSSSLEGDRLAKVRPDAELLDIEDLGLTELTESGLTNEQVDVELAARMAARVGVRSAIVDFDFPLVIAERLRADGVDLTVDFEGVLARRRRKSEAELQGICRAQRAAEAAMREAASMLARAEADGERLRLDGQPLTAERIRLTLRDVAWQHGTQMPDSVIVASVWQGTGHDPGFGPLPAGLPIEIDIWPCDTTSGCWADMTRTFVVGAEPPAEALRQERLVDQALRDALAAIRPGITGRELHAHTCDLFEADGYRTQRTGRGAHPMEGFQFSLGHGVGLRVHESPGLGRSGVEPLVAGDVLALEPGLFDPTVGGVRFEDLALVTDDGCELLTHFSYALDPRRALAG